MSESGTSHTTAKRRRVSTPTILQMEATECGAASLAIVLAYHGRFVPLEQLRIDCGVSRDGSKASKVLKAARDYGFVAKGYRKEIPDLADLPLPFIVFWNFNHFLVVEGFGSGRVYLNDPATGPRVVSSQEFDDAFTGIVLTFERGAEFTKGGSRPGLVAPLRRRLEGSGSALVYAVLTGLLVVVPGLAIPTFTRVFVDDVLIGALHSWLKPLLLGMAITAVLRACLVGLQQATLSRLQAKVSLATSGAFLSHVLRLPMEFYYQRFPGEIGSRVMINDKVAQLLSGRLATAIIGVFTMVFYFVVMLTYDVVLTAIGVTLAALNMIAVRYVSRKRTDESQRLLRARGEVTGASMSGLTMMEDLKATGGEAEFFTDWAGRYAKAVNAEQALGIYTAYLTSVPPLLVGLNTAALLAVGGFRVMDGHLSVGMLVAFQSFMASFNEPVTQLVNLGTELQELKGNMARIDDVLRYREDPALSAEAEAAQAPTKIVRLDGHVELRNITFGYSRLEPPLLTDFSLTLRPGERVAIVGGSGSGKSTIAKLVAGLYEPWEGEILFDGRRRRDVPRSVINNSVGFVDQDIFLFSGTLRDNLTVWDTTMSEASVVQAGRDAKIHDDIVIRRDGYDGVMAEGGANFSGGQRQRLEIARALVGNPSVLILDEATSALDSTTEKVIDDNVRRRGCTCLIVAHRLSTIRDCDEIIVLEYGRVVQRGTHELLKDIDGPYARLIET